MVKSAIERLVDVHPDLEIWWDSSPLVFEAWASKMADAGPASRKGELRDQLTRLRFSEEVLNDDIPSEVLLKMNRIPYMRQSWDENGMEVDQFNAHPATVATAEVFSQATVGLEAYVGERMAVLT
jgi:hypothetical protein